jgi:hypothetical protein
MEIRKRVRLPHWDVNEGAYFVTFNQHDAFPADYREKLNRERFIRMSELERLKGKATTPELHEIERLIRERAEEVPDQGAGSSHLRDPPIAQLVADAITHFDEDRYTLLAWSVMPNHVHVLFVAHQTVDRILQSWKSFTSKAANKLLQREGTFWQEDDWDRLIRSREEFGCHGEVHFGESCEGRTD